MPDAGFQIKVWEGKGGRIWLPGLGAVLATLDTWTLQRREDAPLDEPRWDLHGVFSYVNPVLLKQEGLRWVLEFPANRVTYIATFDRDRFTFDNFNFRITGATLNVRS